MKEETKEVGKASSKGGVARKGEGELEELSKKMKRSYSDIESKKAADRVFVW